MLCPRCETPVPAAPQPARAGALCPQCGALLAPPGLTRRLLAKVSQLARFGLAEDERAALVALDREALRERFAINPMLLYQLEQRVSSA